MVEEELQFTVWLSEWTGICGDSSMWVILQRNQDFFSLFLAFFAMVIRCICILVDVLSVVLQCVLCHVNVLHFSMDVYLFGAVFHWSVYH